ncbi:nucleotide exchange factor GrpE [Ferruginibacter sp.]|uniref:nucleotide exchange factor GrpE n=1 Tax=Ferruginibacter sp. TaxID=1940288 RepID=UPI0026581087|nr:nucleotide exchange factor GrpE [Ferruginibacter sp.]
MKVGKMFDYRTFAPNLPPSFLYKEEGLNYYYMEQKIKGTEDEQFTSEQMEGFQDINADSDIPGNTHLSNEDGENPLEKIQSELEEQKDKYIRLFAEFDNYKRRSAKERIELIQTAGKEVITSLLDVLDDSERAEKQLQTSKDLEQIKKGIELVFGKLRNILQAKGLKAMESIHTNFDVEKHEAITEIPAPTEELKDKVLDEVQKGYYLNDKIIRFAKVVVGK